MGFDDAYVNTFGTRNVVYSVLQTWFLRAGVVRSPCDCCSMRTSEVEEVFRFSMQVVIAPLVGCTAFAAGSLCQVMTDCAVQG